MPKAKQKKKQIVVTKPKPSKPKPIRKYKNRIIRKTGAPTKPNMVKSAARNLAHARWSVTRNEYQSILKKLPANKSVIADDLGVLKEFGFAAVVLYAILYSLV